MGIRFPFSKGGKPRNPFTGGNPFGKIKETVKREILDEIRDEAIKPLEREVNKLKDEAEEVAKKAAMTIFEEITRAFSKEAVKLLKRWGEAFEPESLELQLGPVTFHFEPRDKYDDIQNLVKSRPKGKSGVLAIARTLSPTKYDLSASASLALGIGSDELGVAVAVRGIKPKRFIEQIGKI